MAKKMNVGDVSGCLEVIGNCDEFEKELQLFEYKLALDEWNYHVNQGNISGEMPEEFMHKYISKVKKSKYEYIGLVLHKTKKDERFLYHNQKPNTHYELAKAFCTRKLYRVKCTACGRMLYTDAETFWCTKWKNCVPKCSVIEPKIDYSKSLYNFNSNINELHVRDCEIVQIEEMFDNALTYYSSYYKYSWEGLRIAYISDIHLNHHLQYYDGNIKKMIYKIVDELYQSKGETDIVLFDGDISESPEITMLFFSQYKSRYNFQEFQAFKKQLHCLKRLKKEGGISQYVTRFDKIKRHIEEKKEHLSLVFDFTIFEKYRKKYRSTENYQTAFKSFVTVKSFKKYGVSDATEKEIYKIAELMDVAEEYENKIKNDEENFANVKYEITCFEKKYSKSINKVSLVDYKGKSLKGVYFVIGNHDYISFTNVKTGVEFYTKNLAQLGIKVLQNECVETDKYLLYGGTGFAKYDPVWNADKVLCCPGFTREDEIKETTAFEVGYKKALKYAKKKGLCFLCVSHYPVSSCLNNVFDRETIYFTGHDHRNTYVKKEDKVLYADNQIGYENNHICFKSMKTGFEVNPYNKLQEGLFQTTVEDYLQFYRYLGEHVGDGRLLYQRCRTGKLYVVKRKGYYGFFIISTQKGSEGISIVNGGVTKKITKSTDISWICENFSIVVSKYLQMLLPLRKVQEELSKELKELGLAGTIHGLIVDIDYYHHIAINPIEGSIEFYYSSIWGKAIELSSFEEVIESLEYHRKMYQTIDYQLLRVAYQKKLNGGGCLLGMAVNNHLIEDKSCNKKEVSQRVEQIISRTDGIYGVSRKISHLQRLFSGHVLRDFDLRLTETKQQLSHRKKLYNGCLFKYDGIDYQIVEDVGGDIVVAAKVQNYSKTRGKGIKISDEKRKFAIEELKTKIKNRNELNTYWVDMKKESMI